MTKKKQMQEAGLFWKKMKDSKLTAEEFARTEELECSIIDCENRIEECKKELMNIQREAKEREKMNNKIKL